MAPAVIGLKARLLRGRKIDVRGRTGRIVGREHRLDRPLADWRCRDRRGNALAGSFGDIVIDQLRRIGAAGATQIAAVEPFARDPLQLPEEIELRIFAGITELRM